MPKTAEHLKGRRSITLRVSALFFGKIRDVAERGPGELTVAEWARSVLEAAVDRATSPGDRGVELRHRSVHQKSRVVSIEAARFGRYRWSCALLCGHSKLVSGIARPVRKFLVCETCPMLPATVLVRKPVP